MSFIRLLTYVALLFIPFFLFAEKRISVVCSAEKDSLPKSAKLDSIAIEMINPVNSLKSIDVELWYRSYQGELPNSDKQTASTLYFRPSFSFSTSKGRNIILRATVPVNLRVPTYSYFAGVNNHNEYEDFTEWRIRQEGSSIRPDGDFYSVHSHMYDIGFDAAYGWTNDKNLFCMFGMAFEFPTSEDISGARGQLLIGPELSFGKIFSHGIFGCRLSHLTDIISSDSRIDYNTNLTDLRLFLAIGIGNGWQVVSNSDMTFDWEGEVNNRLSIPLGAGIAKTFLFRNLALRSWVETSKYVTTPETFGPDLSVRFGITSSFINF